MEELREADGTAAAETADDGRDDGRRPPGLDELVAEYDRLAKSFPLPDGAAVLADYGWHERHTDSPEVTAHRGRCVAIMNGKVLGAGPEPLALRVEWAKRLCVHPERLVVADVWDGTPLDIGFPDDPAA